MLQFEQHEASVRSVNQRIQKHGKERILAGDLVLACTAPNTILETIEPGLRLSLFRKHVKGDQLDFDHEQKAAAAQIIDGLVAVRHPGLAPVSVSHKFTGYELTIEDTYDDSSVEPIVLVALTLKKLTIQPLEGGSVALSFTVSTELTKDEIAELSDALVRETVRITLTPPSAQAQQEDLAA